MTLRLYNTLTRQKEDFAPLDPDNVRMYVCGPTVYDYAHIGNARPVIVFDVLFRLLRHLYGPEHVTYVRNVTDVDDKINARAAEVAAAKGIAIEAARAEITAATAKQYEEDVAALGCLPPTWTPRATEYVVRNDGKQDMVNFIRALIETGHAYVAEGHVLFDVTSKPDYGKLARRSLDEMIAGARVEVAPYKRNPMDFVLWKPSDDATPGWESPWGRGRPGWHIECSAMGEALLGETFDIHGGGIDLMFPHHENEIAQSEGAHHGHPLARVWMHNGFLQVEGEKMAKSLGNFVTIRELLERWPGTSLRLAMLLTHYRQPIDWTAGRLKEIDEELRSWVFLSLDHEAEVGSFRVDLEEGVPPRPHPKVIRALLDDLNTSDAIAALRELFDSAKRGGDFRAFYESAFFLGVVDPYVSGAYWMGVGADTAPDKGAEWLFARFDLVQALKIALINRMSSRVFDLTREIRTTGADVEIAPYDQHVTLRDEMTEATIAGIEQDIDARNAARKAKNFKEADRIRDELLAKGIVLKDGPTGTTWEVKR